MRAYVLAREFYGVVLRCARPRDWRERALVTQLLRASSSVCLNIAEGAGEYSRAEKVRFYRIARRSAWECSAAVDLLLTQWSADREPLRAAAATLDDVSALLTTMITRMPITPKPHDAPPDSLD